MGAGAAHAAIPVHLDAPRVERVVMEAAPITLLAQRQISASEAKRIALRRVPGGEVVDISRNGNVYRVRIVARSGRVVDVAVDASTGRIVG